MTVNDMKARGCSMTPHPNASEEGRPERVPCAGNGNGTSLNNAGSNGNYWSSVPNSDNNNAWTLNFNSGNHNTNNNNRNNGQSVRPVQVFTTDPLDGVPHRGLDAVDFSRTEHKEHKDENSLCESLRSLRLKDRETALLADLIVAYHDARRHKRAKFYQTHFEMNQERELVSLRDELLERRYVARPSSCFIIHDPKMREVFAAEFRDRVVHHLFYNYTHKLFERTFIADCYSCIEGRGTHYGVERLKHHIRSCSQNWSKPCYVLKLDIKGYFMSINRARLLARCRELLGRVAPRRDREEIGRDGARPSHWDLIDYLLESICMLNPVENCRILGDKSEWKMLPKDKSLFFSKEGCGLPIGNLSSQLFSNIYLGMLDDFMKREMKCRHYGRYVDDAFVVAPSKEELYGLVPRVRKFLRDELDLELNEDKVRVVDAYKGVEFLGAFIKPYRTYPATRTLRRMRGRLKSLDWSERPKRIQARVNSMLGVLSHYDCWHIRKVLAWEGHLREFGEVTDDCLRFYPDVLKIMVGSRVLPSRVGRALRASRRSKVGRGAPPCVGSFGSPRRLATPCVGSFGSPGRLAPPLVRSTGVTIFMKMIGGTR